MFYDILVRIFWAAIKMLAPIILAKVEERKSPEEEAKDNKAYSENTVRKDAFHKHPDEGGHR